MATYAQDSKETIQNDTVVFLQEQSVSIQIDNSHHDSVDAEEEADDANKRRKRQRYSAQQFDNRLENRLSQISSNESHNNMSFEYSLSKENKESRDSIKKSIDATPTDLDDVRMDSESSVAHFAGNRKGSCFGDFGLLTDNLYPNQFNEHVVQNEQPGFIRIV